MENKLEKIKNIYERRNTSNTKAIRNEFIKSYEQEKEEINNDQIDLKKRKSSVHDIVKIYEERVRECI